VEGPKKENKKPKISFWGKKDEKVIWTKREKKLKKRE
jgi:hypothetical protein